MSWHIFGHWFGWPSGAECFVYFFFFGSAWNGREYTLSLLHDINVVFIFARPEKSLSIDRIIRELRALSKYIVSPQPNHILHLYIVGIASFHLIQHPNAISLGFIINVLSALLMPWTFFFFFFHFKFWLLNVVVPKFWVKKKRHRLREIFGSF